MCGRAPRPSRARGIASPAPVFAVACFVEGTPMNTSPRRFLLAALSLAALLVALPARATFHTYQIQEIFSNADGSVQYVVLRECCGANGQNLLGQGHSLTAMQGMYMQAYAFPNDLPCIGGGGGYGYG